MPSACVVGLMPGARQATSSPAQRFPGAADRQTAQADRHPVVSSASARSDRTRNDAWSGRIRCRAGRKPAIAVIERRRPNRVDAGSEHRWVHRSALIDDDEADDLATPPSRSQIVAGSRSTGKPSSTPECTKSRRAAADPERQSEIGGESGVNRRRPHKTRLASRAGGEATPRSIPSDTIGQHRMPR